MRTMRTFSDSVKLIWLHTFKYKMVINVFAHFVVGGAVAYSGTTSDSGAKGRGFDPHSGRGVVSLSKIHLPPKSTGNTQEAVVPSRHD